VNVRSVELYSAHCMLLCRILFFFFFSSRRRHTRFKCDWSSDVCSSDLRCANHDRASKPRGPPANPRGHRASAADSTSRWHSRGQIGRASCRERVEESGGGVAEDEKRRKCRERQEQKALETY